MLQKAASGGVLASSFNIASLNLGNAIGAWLRGGNRPVCGIWCGDVDDGIAAGSRARRGAVERAAGYSAVATRSRSGRCWNRAPRFPSIGANDLTLSRALPTGAPSRSSPQTASNFMNTSLSGWTAVVTGSTAGIGYAIAEELARGGASVVINGRTGERVDAALTQLRSVLPDADFRGVAVDLSSADGAARFIAEVPQADILINNLGIFVPTDFADIDDEEWQRLWDVNVMSGIRLSRHYFGGMLERDRGRVVFLSSESGVQIPAEMIHYGVTKAAQIALARGMAQLTAGTAVTVNSVLAGPTRSEGVGVFVSQLAEQQGISGAEFEEKFFQSARPTSLLGRFAEPAEIARVVAFVASPAASVVNGAAVRAEGGVLLSAF
jgi:NAD(P)-dependent dehydrogenase (short-subunit alcohol dehydrogenase family)